MRIPTTVGAGVAVGWAEASATLAVGVGVGVGGAIAVVLTHAVARRRRTTSQRVTGGTRCDRAKVVPSRHVHALRAVCRFAAY
jgi:hypothetical protein